MNFIALLVFGFFFVALSFIVRNFLLGQEFDIVNELIQLVTFIALVIGAGWLTKKSVNKEAPIKVSTKV